MSRLTVVVLMVWAGLACVFTASGQPITTLYSFAKGPANPRSGLALARDGNYYGTTEFGGNDFDGTFFRVTTNGTITTLVSFSNYGNGSFPVGNLIVGADGALYGTTSAGGTTLSGNNNSGTVFKVTTNGLLTTLVDFNGTNGASPQGGLVAGPDGNFYGTTQFGGTNGDGIVFKMTTNGTLTTLASFNGTNGSNPQTSLAFGLDGSLYGTAEYGGTNNDGTLFKVTTNGVFTLLLNFNGGNGAWPLGTLTLGPDGNFYGTTSAGGSLNGSLIGGTVFEVTTNGTLTTLIPFGVFGTTNGSSSYAGVTLGPDGNFYGTTTSGGANGNGTIFQVNTNGTLAMLAGIPGIKVETYYNDFGTEYYSTNNGTNIAPVLNGTLTTIYNFPPLTNLVNNSGAEPESELILGPDGSFYGTSYKGGAEGNGEVFKVTTNGTFTALAAFSGISGAQPQGGLTVGLDGNLYGTTMSGGIDNAGTLFKMTPDGALTTLVNFDDLNDGAGPVDTLTLGPNGTLYGTASGGGPNLLSLGDDNSEYESLGTVFQLTTNGTFTVLADFNITNGANPNAGVTLGADGSLFGTTTYGGISNNGAVFQLTPGGSLNALASFTGTNGANPYAGLTLGPDGNYYGTTEYGGANSNGNVFQVTTGGILTPIYNFSPTTNTGGALINDGGVNPNSGLTLGPDGNFYGTAYGGGAAGYGTVFRITTGGIFTTLAYFTQTNGSFPIGGLTLGPDGSFYGTTGLGSSIPYGYGGTIFKISTNGGLTTLANFATPGGTAPFDSLTLETNHHFIHFYGTAWDGGSAGAGAVFRFDPPTIYAIAENTTNLFNPLTNEVAWTTGAGLDITSVIATNGTATISDGNILFTPTADFIGTATISYTIVDTSEDTENGFVTVLVTNIPPVANPQSVTTPENTAQLIILSGVDPNHLPTSFSIVRGPLNGTLGEINEKSDGVTYTPNANYSGEDSFTFLVNDGQASSAPATVYITVIPVQQSIPPVASPYSFAVTENTTNIFSPLVNDQVLVQGGMLSLVSVSPTNGTAFISGTNVIFTPSLNFLGTATIGYTITDNVGGTSSSLITVTVTNIPPTANPASFAVTENTTNTFSPLPADQVATPGGTLSLVTVSPTNGTASISGTNVVFTPSPNFVGTATIGYTITDNIGGTSSSLITVTVTNIPPAAKAGNYSITENTTNTLAVLTNDEVLTHGGTLSITSATTTNGSVTITGGTNLVFIPATDFLGTLTIDYNLADNIGGTNSAIVIVTVTNIPPIANPASFAITENTMNILSPLLNDQVETPGGTLSLVSVSPTNGTAFISGNNIFFTPSANFAGTATIGYAITDNIGGISSSLITVIVTNIPPVANPASYSVTENTTNTFDPLVSDEVSTPSPPHSNPLIKDNATPPGGTLSLVSVSPTNGTAFISGTNIIFTPAVNFLGTATIGYTITDNIGGTNSSLITVLVTNIPPVANPVSFTVAENTTNTFSPLPADHVATPGGTLSLVSVNPTNGSASISGTNVVFTPAANFVGTATIGYTITDNIGGTNSSLITVTVTNVPPAAGPGNYSITENTTNIFAVLTNDEVLTHGGTLSITSATTTNGSVAIASGTNLVFVPATNFLGTLTIDYNLTDNIGGTNSTTITVIVTNIPPVANPASYAAAENTTNTFSPLLNDRVSTPGGTLSLVSVSPTNGTASISGTNVIFTPAANFLGTATIGYTITDNIGGTNSSLITVTVSATLPVANPYSFAITENTTNTFSPLVNDSTRTLGASLSLVSVSPTNGTAVISGTNVIFTPSVNFLGTATIGYTITDNVGGTNSSLITVTVTNIPPAANPASFAVTENTTNTFNPLANDHTLTPGGTLSLVSVNPTNGSAAISGTDVIFTPTVNFLGTATIGYTITDNIGGSNSSLITVTVTNIPPAARPGNYSITENTTNTFAVLTNDQVLTHGGTLSITSASTTNGSITVAGGTNLVFVPATNFLGALTINYNLADNIGGTNAGTVTVTVTNIPPLASPAFLSMAENTTNTLAPLTNDSVRTPGGRLSLISVSPTNGTAVISGTNVIFTPTANFLGTATIGYAISDNIGGTNFSLITVMVTNRPPVANPQSIATPFNIPVVITLTGSDPANYPLTFTIVTPPAGGALTGLNEKSDTVTYTPTNGFTGMDAFTVVVNDGLTNSTPATVTITVGAQATADLAVFKTGPAQGFAGSNLVYSITVTNLGPDGATNVQVQDDLPAGLTLAGTTPAYASVSGNTVNWTVASLPAHAQTNFMVTVNSPANGTFTNIATATSDESDPNPANNNGTSTNSQARTVVSPLADVQVFKTGGTNVQAGGVVYYTIMVTNAGPSTASNVVVQDVLPAGTALQSASGEYTVSNNSVMWTPGVLANGAAASFSIALTGPASGSFTNIALATAATPDPNPANNNGSAVASQVATKIVPAADLVALAFGPANAALGSNFVYSLIVSNAGPSVSSNIVASDALPAAFNFMSASAGGTFAKGVVTWPAVKSLAAGATTNYTVTVNSPVGGAFTNIGMATSSTLDPNPTNNSGVAPESQTITAVSFAQFTSRAGTPVFDPQNGLYEETVAVTNTGTGTVAGFQLYVTALPANVYLWNATGTNAGEPYVQYNYPLNPSNSVSLVLQFYNPGRVTFTNQLRIVPFIPAVTGNASTNGSTPVNAVFTDTAGGTTRIVIEFASVPGKTYAILYSSDMVNWQVATPSITATANITQWIDEGPPGTESAPGTVTNRYYRVVGY